MVSNKPENRGKSAPHFPSLRYTAVAAEMMGRLLSVLFKGCVLGKKLGSVTVQGAR